VIEKEKYFLKYLEV